MDDLSPRELSAWRGMLEVHAHVMQRLDAHMRSEHGLSVSSYEVLMFLGDAPHHCLRMSEIADRALLSRSGCTRLVARLVDLGYVVRRPAERDGRGQLAELTGAGLEKLQAARASHLEDVRHFFLDRLTVTDQLALGDVWDRFLAGARVAHDVEDRDAA